MPNKPSAPLDSTAILIQHMRENDKDSLEHLIQQHLAPLRQYVNDRLPRQAKDLADTDDLVQDTLLRTFSKMDAFEVHSVKTLQAYLQQTMMNRLQNELRRKKRTPALINVDELKVTGPESPLEKTIGTEATARYVATLTKLEPEEREAIIGHMEMEYSYADLAKMLGKPTADAARKTAQRTLLRLTKEMKACT